MSTAIKASCPVCGEVSLTPADIELWVCADAPDLSTYAFRCPSCQDRVSKAAPDRVVSLLVSGGVPAQVWSLPLEVHEEHTGPAICEDDLLAFGLALESTPNGTGSRSTT